MSQDPISVHNKEVSYSNPLPVTTIFSDGPQLDAFKRLRVSIPTQMGDYKTLFDMDPWRTDNILVGGALATYLPNESAVQLDVTSASGSKATRRTRQYVHYHPGKSQLMKLTALFGVPVTNIIRRAGLFDDFNGLYFAQNGDGLQVGRRTFTTGSVQNFLVSQKDWNMDTLDGSGGPANPSGIKLEPSLPQLFIIDFEWLGVGRIRWGIDFGFKIVYVHSIVGGNTLPQATMQTPDLPVTWEIENAGAVIPASFKAMCASVDNEGGSELQGPKFSQPMMAIKNVAKNAVTPLITIRLKSTFNGKTNRMSVLPIEWWANNTAASSTIALLQVVRNATLTGTPSWVSVDPNSGVEYDVSATGIIDGAPIDSVALAGTQYEVMSLDYKNSLTRSADSASSDMFTIICTSLNGTCQMLAGLDWKEWR